MPKIQAFSIDGVMCWFWSNDHGPPHFHAKKSGEWEIRISFLESQENMVEVISRNSPSNKVLKSITKKAEAHRSELLAEWEKVHGNQ